MLPEKGSNMSRFSRFKIIGLALSGVVVASSCTFDSTSPTLSDQTTATARSSFVPTEAEKARYVIGAGVSSYKVTINPNELNTFTLGSNAIVIPAHAVCRLADSGYGVGTWNNACAPETSPIAVTVTVRADNSGRPRMDFQPAMRFSPDVDVELFMFTRQARKEARQFKIYYCADDSIEDEKCVDESLTDRDLRTYVDPSSSVIFRRIKHFSGYLVAE